ncbi:MAG: ABC transporter permease [Candidatus Syntrophosphaera sp.]|jgi:ABC-type nitrate/sulfonate/bicarbonate transport system permease component
MKKRLSRYVLPSLFLLFLILLWQILGSKAKIAFWVLPAPLDVLDVFKEHLDLIWHHLKPTLWESVSGLFLATLLGVATAMAMHSSKIIRQILYPYMVVSQTVPIIAIAPLIVLWFGYGIPAKIFVVVLVCFFPIALGLFDGLKQVSMEQIMLLKSMGAGNWKIYRLLKIPASLPNFFTGLRLAATYSVMGAVIGEWLGGNAGLGIYLTRSTKSFRTAHVFAAIFVIILLSMVMFGIVTALDRILLSWHYKKLDEYEDTSH